MEKKEFINEIDYNKSSKACPTCASDCKKIDKIINKRELTDLKPEEIPHVLKVFDL